MKKLINDPLNVVDDFLAGFALAHADLVQLNARTRTVTRVGEPQKGKVVVLSGGGSGHEPLHVGFVGPGMLDAAVAGEIFSSPTPDSILAALQSVGPDAGALLVVKNYTGDVLNFETAAEFASAEGLLVRSILINDDVAVEDSAFTAGRRGVAGAVLVEKIAGAAAERGDDLASVLSLAERTNASMRTLGVALTAGVVPHSGTPSFEIADDEIEFGVGLHGEPGRKRMGIAAADAIVDELLDAIVSDLPFSAGDRLLLYVNGLGGTPDAELYIVYGRAAQELRRRGFSVDRTLVGNFVTSLDMHGVSITLLRLDDELVELWDAPVHTAALRWGC